MKNSKVRKVIYSETNKDFHPGCKLWKLFVAGRIIFILLLKIFIKQLLAITLIFSYLRSCQENTELSFKIRLIRLSNFVSVINMWIICILDKDFVLVLRFGNRNKDRCEERKRKNKLEGSLIRHGTPT